MPVLRNKSRARGATHESGSLGLTRDQHPDFHFGYGGVSRRLPRITWTKCGLWTRVDVLSKAKQNKIAFCKTKENKFRYCKQY